MFLVFSKLSYETFSICIINYTSSLHLFIQKFTLVSRIIFLKMADSLYKFIIFKTACVSSFTRQNKHLTFSIKLSIYELPFIMFRFRFKDAKACHLTLNKISLVFFCTKLPNLSSFSILLVFFTCLFMY